jgi:hypothetical protein
LEKCKKGIPSEGISQVNDDYFLFAKYNIIFKIDLLGKNQSRVLVKIFGSSYLALELDGTGAGKLVLFD